MPRGFDPNNCVTDWQDAEKQHGKQQGEVEVITLGHSKHDLVRHVACHDSPRPQVHHYHELDDIQNYEARGKEHPHPNHSLVINQM